MGASVKVMLSYDYCHFEVCKSSDQELTNEQIDEMRKDCMRLCDKAIRQYKIAKASLSGNTQRKEEWERLRREVEVIERLDEGDRTPNQMAKVKLLRDRDWDVYISECYDYQDDWEDQRDFD